MDKIKVDLLKAKYQLPELPATEKKRPIRFFGRFFMTAMIVCATFGAVFSYEIVTSSDTFAGFPRLSIFSTLAQLVTSGDKKLNGEADDRINFLILGVGGEGHDGPELSDTIIFASLRPSDNTVGMISIPRDMTVPIPGYGSRKVNHVNAFGEQLEPGSGPSFAADVIGDLFQQEIHYYVKVDFDGFGTLIDALGGVDVYVDKSFTDYEYPTEDDLYQTIAFSEGWQTMDGDDALKFVRSRHGNNGEGSDFARSRRQQKVIMALKDKMMDMGTLLNPAKVTAILDTLGEHVETNLTMWEMLRLGDMAKNIDTANIVNHVLDSSPESPLYATSLNGAYVLLPKNDDWGRVRSMAANVLYADDEIGTDDVPTAPVEVPQLVRVEIQNGTNVTGLAFQTSQLLQGQGYEIVKIGNAEERGYEHTVIYDLTDGQRAEELKALQDFLKADVSMSASGWMVSPDIIPTEIAVTDDDSTAKTTESDIDFLVILGESSANMVLR